MKKTFRLLAVAASLCVGVAHAQTGGLIPSGGAPAAPVAWSVDTSFDLAAFNKDLEPGKPTMDVAVYLPSNFDPGFDKVTLPRMLEGIKAAKEIFKPAGVQINLLWVKTGAVNPSFLTIQANDIPRVPDTEYANSYESMRRHPSQLSNLARNAFESIVEQGQKDSDRTLYLVALQDVFFPFLDVAHGRNWTMKMVRTGGLSFPSYSYHNTIPSRLRGIITISNLSKPERARRTIAHEIGHKVMNVSHEYKSTDPAHEVHAEGGLMLYGSGVDIPCGLEGRWHHERLHLSPYLYRLDANGKKQWNADYKEGGHYYDPLYGDKVVHFKAVPKIDPNW